MVSWTAWSGHQHHQQESEAFDAVKEDKQSLPAAGRNRTLEPPPLVVTRPEPPPPPASGENEPKRRPVSRLWPSFSSIGRDRSASRVQADPSLLLPPPAEEEHIYEEIDDMKERGRGLSRAGRGGSFAGASRQDILRYLEELRKKHPTGIISVEAEQRERKRPNSPSPASPMTPSLPQLIPADEEEDDEMGALLLAMRHNGPNRNSNRSTQSSTSTQSSSQESALSAPGITPTSSTGGYQVKQEQMSLRVLCHDGPQTDKKISINRRLKGVGNPWVKVGDVIGIDPSRHFRVPVATHRTNENGEK